MDLTNLHWLGAAEAAGMIRDGVISSVQLVEACLARVRDVDGQVQALAVLRPQHSPGPAPPAHAGWVVERVGRGMRRRHGAAGAWQPDHRLDDPPRRVLRGLWLQADARPGPAARYVPALAHARSRRPVHPLARGCRIAAGAAR